MNDDNTKDGNNHGNNATDSGDELIDKGKDLADKAEDFFSEKVNELKNSDVFGKVSGFFGAVEEFMEDKSEKFQSGEMGAKFEAFKDKASDQANDLLKKAKEAGQKIGDQVDETIDSFKGKKGSAGNQNGGGI